MDPNLPLSHFEIILSRKKLNILSVALFWQSFVCVNTLNEYACAATGLQSVFIILGLFPATAEVMLMFNSHYTCQRTGVKTNRIKCLCSLADVI